MDYHALQQKLFALDPSDPKDDLAKLQAHAQGTVASDIPPTKDYVNESAKVAPGSMPVGLDSIADFAALAGVQVNEAQKHGDYAKGSDPMPSAEPERKKHPLKDKLVGEDENTEQNPEIDSLIEKFVAKGMPKKAARMFAQIAYMHFNQQNDDRHFAHPDQFKKSPYERLPRDADNNPRNSIVPMSSESTTESIKDRLYAALKEYK